MDKTSVKLTSYFVEVILTVSVVEIDVCRLSLNVTLFLSIFTFHE